ncbi:riboflavin synthase [Cytobacillus sp. IB215665]|uniref:riboflavin synthase n=1 Tax=Cytobacillus sp. IB215665 TaxID=3097357 RepID=UPI002A123E3A|nr:riboflavin synthase [Cytobacillus sp. IB215665]MDX8364778.1 riboflavin synthase [Cytobacillus sp. IB215665]
MFTGIVEEVGKVNRLTHSIDAIELQIDARKILSDIQLGDSIAVNGVCLTVTSFNEFGFAVDVMPETIKATSLKLLKNGSSVNLERAMLANGRFGGHFVSGHVDGVGEIISKTRKGNAIYYVIAIDEKLAKYILHKGSVAVDGTSLTIFDVVDKSFTISIIPHTLSETIIGQKEVGDIVNIECDVIGKYIEHFLLRGTHSMEKVKHSRITKSILTENGFI